MNNKYLKNKPFIYNNVFLPNKNEAATETVDCSCSVLGNTVLISTPEIAQKRRSKTLTLILITKIVL